MNKDACPNVIRHLLQYFFKYLLKQQQFKVPPDDYLLVIKFVLGAAMPLMERSDLTVGRVGGIFLFRDPS